MTSLFSFKGLVSSLLFAGLSTAAPATQEHDLEVRGPTCNTASNRACWSSGFDINTDYEASTPAGGSVSYSWEITEHYNWVGPDGHVKPYVQLVNGQLPGPTLRASWGDSISVTIKNSLPDNG
jgi:FtsP/CotA-like multicopper oxidase with cupredoxin domain